MIYGYYTNEMRIKSNGVYNIIYFNIKYNIISYIFCNAILLWRGIVPTNSGEQKYVCIIVSRTRGSANPTGKRLTRRLPCNHVNTLILWLLLLLLLLCIRLHACLLNCFSENGNISTYVLFHNTRVPQTWNIFRVILIIYTVDNDDDK